MGKTKGGKIISQSIQEIKPQKFWLIELDDFDLWVHPTARGVSQELIVRAGRLAQFKDPGPIREPAFTWILNYEINRLMITQEELRFFDLGANIGYFCAWVANKARERKAKYKIWAVEPDPVNFHLLKANFKQNNIIGMCEHIAISDKSGIQDFYLSDMSSCGSLLYRQGKSNCGKLMIRTRTLKDYIQNYIGIQPQFIKMDIEGGEELVFRGSREYLVNCKSPFKILLEVHPTDYQDGFDRDLRFLLNNGWMCSCMVSAAMGNGKTPFNDLSLISFKEFNIRERSHDYNHKRIIYCKDDNDRQDWNDIIIEFATKEYHPGIPRPGKSPSKKLIRSILLEKI